MANRTGCKHSTAVVHERHVETSGVSKEGAYVNIARVTADIHSLVIGFQNGPELSE